MKKDFIILGIAAVSSGGLYLLKNAPAKEKTYGVENEFLRGICLAGLIYSGIQLIVRISGVEKN